MVATTTAPMKVGDVFLPPYFIQGVIAVWLLVQAGVLATVCLRRRKARLDAAAAKAD